MSRGWEQPISRQPQSSHAFLESCRITFYDLERELQDTYAVAKRTKLRADKKVFKGKPKLEDFHQGDIVRIKMVVEEIKLLEVRLAKRAESG